MIGIIDYGNGNIFNIHKCISKYSSEKISLISNKEDLFKCSRIIFPGVGHYEKTMLTLRKNDLINHLIDLKKKDIPILAICIGMHIMGRYSDESNQKGLNFYDFQVKRFNKNDVDIVPNINWINLDFSKQHKIEIDLNLIKKYYFSHSFYIDEININKKNIIYSTYKETKFISLFKDKNIISTQFHPELSGDSGDTIIKAFLKL